MQLTEGAAQCAGGVLAASRSEPRAVCSTRQPTSSVDGVLGTASAPTAAGTPRGHDDGSSNRERCEARDLLMDSAQGGEGWRGDGVEPGQGTQEGALVAAALIAVRKLLGLLDMGSIRFGKIVFMTTASGSGLGCAGGGEGGGEG